MRNEEELQRIVEARRDDPFAFSQLPYWLGLEVWTRSEGLLVLAGVEPDTVERDKDLDPIGLFPEVWINAMLFSQHIAFFQMPDPQNLTPADHNGDEAKFDQYLEQQEDRQSLLRRYQNTYESLLHKLDHSPSALGDCVVRNKWRPLAFLAWARTINFEPEWLGWAQTNGLLPDGLHPTTMPYFDADSDDYPELLHIAVRAWEHARKGGDGTPKQRVLAFLAERYQSLPQNARDAIAQVANWKKAGGRPTKERKK